MTCHATLNFVLLSISPGSRKCSHKKQDLFIVIDGSRKVGADEFNQAKTFLQDFVTRLDVGLGRTHVGLLLVDRKEKTKIEISLGQYDSKNSLSNAIGRIKHHKRRRSDMAHALELVQNKVRMCCVPISVSSRPWISCGPLPIRKFPPTYILQTLTYLYINSIDILIYIEYICCSFLYI